MYVINSSSPFAVLTEEKKLSDKFRCELTGWAVFYVIHYYTLILFSWSV